MNCQELAPLLSEHIDAALPPERGAEAAAHLRQCDGCSRQAELLRGVGKLLKGLARRPLPGGFLARLQARRSFSPEPSLFSPRALGYAFAAVFVGVVVLRTTRPAPAPVRAAPEGPLAEVAQAPVPRSRPAPFRDTGEPLLKSAAPAETPLLPKPAPSGSLAAPESAAMTGVGEPAFSRSRSGAYDRAQAAKAMKQDGEALGIQEINPGRDQSQTEPFLGRQLGDPSVRAHAQANIDALVAMRRAIEDSSGKPKPVRIAGGTAPVLGKDEARNGLLLDGEAPSTDAWSGDYAGTNEGTKTIGDPRTWAALWRSIAPDAPIPSVDFSRKEVVAVFLGARPTGGYAAQLLSITSNETAVTVVWREAVPQAGVPPPEGQTTPYAMRVIDRSELPVRFEKAPKGR